MEKTLNLVLPLQTERPVKLQNVFSLQTIIKNSTDDGLTIENVLL